MREALEIKPRWILEIAGHYYEDQRLKIAEEKHGKQIIEAELKNELIEK